MKAFLATLACAGLIVATRLPWFGDHIYNLDTAVRGTLGWGWSEGLAPLRDLYGSTKPPGLDLLYMGLFKVFGFSLVSLQWLALGLALATALAVGLLAKALFDGRAGFYAAFAYAGASCFVYGPMDWLEPHTEYLATLLVLLAALCLAPLARGGSCLWAFPSGLLLAEAAFTRQNVLLFAFPLALGFGLMAWRQRPRAVPFALFWGLAGLAGGIAPWAWYYRQLGALDNLLLFSWTLPGAYATGHSPLDALLGMPFALGAWATSCAPVAGLGLWYLLQKEEGSRLRGAKLLVLFMLLGGIAAASFGGRPFGHYLLMMAPFAALAAAGAVAVLAPVVYSSKVKSAPASPVAGVLALLFFVWLIAGALSTVQPPLRAIATNDPGSLTAYYAGEKDWLPAVKTLVQKNTPPGSRIAVFGHPSVYIASDRLPAARDFWGNFLTGYWGHASDPKAFAFARGDWAQDIASGKAALVVDLGGEGHERLTDYPEIAKALKTNYKLSIPLSAKAPNVLIWAPKKPVKPAQ